MKKRVESLILAIVMVLTGITAGLVPGKTVYAQAWDPDQAAQQLDVRFWEEEVSDSDQIRFYINGAARYILETVQEPGYGTNNGEWSVLGLLRGMYTGLDYMNDIPETYFNGYISRMEKKVEELYEAHGTLDYAKSTEYSRLMLAMTALGYDVTNVAGKYDFIDKLSSSYQYSYRQGINGPIWELIALHTGGYELLEEPSEAVDQSGVNTVGKMLDYIAGKEITQEDGSVGGWALSGEKPDPDITGMALQALAPYYLDASLYQEKNASADYEEFARMVERGILQMSAMQLDNGGYDSWGSVNSESIVQVIVALTALGIDPKSDSVELPYLNTSCSFVTEGAVRDGVFTDNMIDALLTFWAEGSGSSPAVGGFKHVTAGNDGGGGAGTTVNGMATDQALYGLIAYDRFLHGENSLYDMTDMVDGSYQQMQSASYVLHFDGNGKGNSFSDSYSPYQEIAIPSMEEEPTFIGWNTKADGSGAFYEPGEVLLMPEQEATLYAQYGKAEYQIQVELNGGVLQEGIQIPQTYTPRTEDIVLPGEGQIQKPGCIFLGWYDHEDLSGSPVTVISKGSYGDRILYAGWRVDYTKLNQFYALVNQLNIGGITISDRSTILKARALYDEMTEAERGEIHAYTYARLLDAEKELEALETSLSEIEKVVSLIENLPGEPTLEDEAAVLEAREAYENLTQEQQGQVENYPSLLRAEAALAQRKEDQQAAWEVKDKIQALGEITLESEQAVREAREAYNSLNSDRKALVGQKALKQLEEAEQKLSALQESAVRVQTMREMIAQALQAEVSLENASLLLVTEAHGAYLSLTQEERQQISKEDWQEILERENQLYFLANDGNEEDWETKAAVERMISALGGETSLEDEERIAAAEEAYQALTQKQKALVENYYSLVMHKNDLVRLKNDLFVAGQLIARIEQIGEVTLGKEELIRQIRKDYGALSTDQKLLISNYAQMVQAENQLADMKYDERKAKEAIQKILAIDEVITMDSREGIDQARAAYDSLTDSQKEYVGQEYLKLLEDAQTEYRRIESLQLRGISISETRLTLAPGESKELVLTYEPEDTISDKTAVWSSSNEKVAQVADGVVKAVANGEAVVTVRVGKLSVSCNISVQTPMTGIALNKSEVSLKKGAQELLSVSFLPASTTEERILVWESSNPQVVRVDQGKLIAVGVGTAQVTVSCGSHRASCQVNVSNFTIEYRLNGGSNAKGNPVSHDGTKTIALQEPARSGYRFAGWYTDFAMKTKITSIPAGSLKDYTLYAKWTKVKKPGKPVIKKVQSKGAGKITIQLKKKAARAEGYEIQYARNKKFTKQKKQVQMKGQKTTLKKLKKGTAYYIRVRAFCKDSAGNRIYSGFSKKIRITTAK